MEGNLKTYADTIKKLEENQSVLKSVSAQFLISIFVFFVNNKKTPNFSPIVFCQHESNINMLNVNDFFFAKKTYPIVSQQIVESQEKQQNFQKLVDENRKLDSNVC